MHKVSKVMLTNANLKKIACIKVIDRRIFEVTASPEYFSKPKQASWGS